MIEKYIVELLYKNDCVIVPGFGGFILNYRHAVIDESNGIFKPPFKELAFNSSLTKDDGLLCSYIASERNITYIKAKEFVGVYVNDLSDRLYLRETVVFEELGYFMLDEANNIVFVAQQGKNFYEDCLYFNNYSIKKLEIQSVVKEKDNVNDKNDIITNTSENTIPIKKLLRYAATVLLIIACGTLSYLGADYCLQNVYNAGFTFFKHKIDLSSPHTMENDKSVVLINVNDGANSFVDRQCIISNLLNDSAFLGLTNHSISIDSISAVNDMDSAQIELPVVNNNVTTTEKTVVDRHVNNVCEVDEKDLSKDDLIVKKDNVISQYIIVASFPGRNVEDAKEYALRMRKEGFKNASVIYDRGRSRVAVYCGTDSLTTERELTIIKENFNSSAWILYY